MKIAHLLLANQYCDGFLYQENLLARQNVLDGHDVLVIASVNVVDTVGDKGFLAFVRPGRYIDSNGVHVVRVPYKLPLPNVVNSKIRAYKTVVDELESFNPDLVMFHGVGGLGILDAVRYKKEHPCVALVIDNHASIENSGKNWFSKHIIHSLFGRLVWRKAWDIADRIYNIAPNCSVFLERYYRVPKCKMDLLPLCGVTLGQSEYNRRRTAARRKYGIDDEQLLFVHSGKMVQYKKPWDVIAAFDKCADENAVLMLSGKMDEETKSRTGEVIRRNSRIKTTGWLDGAELIDVLCAADVYIQGWSQSATVQNAACLNCALVIPYCDTYDMMFGNEALYIFEIADIEKSISELCSNRAEVARRGKAIGLAAKRNCSYETISKLLYDIKASEC